MTKQGREVTEAGREEMSYLFMVALRRCPGIAVVNCVRLYVIDPAAVLPWMGLIVSRPYPVLSC